MDINEAKVVRYQNANGEPALTYYYEIAGDSTETKPTANVADGSIFTETDTGDVYIYNAKGAEWNKMFGLSGGGGAGQNKKSVITGTLATFADDFAEFFGITNKAEATQILLDYKSGKYNSVLYIDGTVLGAGGNYFPFNTDYSPDSVSVHWYGFGFIWGIPEGVLETGALIDLKYDDGFTLYAWMYQNGDGTNPTDIMPYAANIPYELTVYEHPMS